MGIDLSDYYSGGYFLIRGRNPDGSNFAGMESYLNSRGLLPNPILSISDCITDIMEIVSGDREAALLFGVAPEKLDEFIKWCYDGDFRDYIDVHAMFYSVASARTIMERFIPDRTNLYIVGIGLHKELEVSEWQPYYETSEYGEHGIEKRIPQHLPLETGGTIMGYEVAGFEIGTIGCSWLCNLLHEDMFDLFGIKPNQYGLIESYDEAKKVLDWINEDKVTRAEPTPYDVWLLMSYPLKHETPS